MSTVQLLQIPLKSSDEFNQPAWKDLVAKFANTSGVTATLWAPQHENAKVGGIAAVWTSLDAQKAWADSPEGKAVKTDIDNLADGPIHEDVVVFSEDPSPVLAAPVVELVSWFHPTQNITDAKREKLDYAFKRFKEAISSQAQEAEGGLVSGWGQVEFEHKGLTSRRFTALIGWKSVEGHFACKKTPVFTDNIHWLRGNDETGVEMVHFPFRSA